VQRDIINEFAALISDGMGAALGGVEFAQTTLDRAKGNFAASAILNRTSSGPRNGAGEEIRHMDSRQVLNLLKDEQPQTVALILSCMDTPKAAEILKLLAPELREEVMERLGSMEPTSADSINKIATNLGQHFDRRAVQQGVHHAGGAKACAEILGSLDKETRKTLLGRIEERNAALGTAIRKIAFSFDDIARLSPADRARVLREVDTADLVPALKTVKLAVMEAVLSVMSKRAAEGLREEIDMLAAPRPRDVEAAQDRIIAVIRRLEEAEEITLDSGGEEDGKA
jgi:flagellar motor switch protein FliG